MGDEYPSPQFIKEIDMESLDNNIIMLGEDMDDSKSTDIVCLVVICLMVLQLLSIVVGFFYAIWLINQ
jgi:hypothetical protein